MSSDRKKPVAASAEPDMPHDLAKLVCKLRWIGMDEEAERLLGEMARRRTAAGEHVFATTGETD